MLSLISKFLGRATQREPRGIEMRLRGAIVGSCHGWERVRLGPGIDLVGGVNVHLAERVTLAGFTCLNASGPTGRIEIGAGTHMDYFGVLYGQGGLSIGRQCAIAARVTIYTQSNQYQSDPVRPILEQPVEYAPVRVGNDVWIGAGAIVLPGVSIGDHAVVGAGSVVRCDVGAWEVVAGVPAKVIRRRDAEIR